MKEKNKSWISKPIYDGRRWVGDKFGFILLNADVCPHCGKYKSKKADTCINCKSLTIFKPPSNE